ncbi:MAG: hypothetical protein RLN78_01040 [Phycisphaerales bacterium]
MELKRPRAGGIDAGRERAFPDGAAARHSCVWDAGVCCPLGLGLNMRNEVLVVAWSCVMELCVVGIVRFVGMVRGCLLADWFGCGHEKTHALAWVVCSVVEQDY